MVQRVIDAMTGAHDGFAFPVSRLQELHVRTQGKRLEQ